MRGRLERLGRLELGSGGSCSMMCELRWVICGLVSHVVRYEFDDGSKMAFSSIADVASHLWN